MALPPVYPYLDASVSGGPGFFSYVELTNYLYGSTTNAITAHSGGGQTSAVPLTTMLNRITVVAAGNDSVLLPPATPGLIVLVNNSDSADSLNVFPCSATQGGVTGGDAINALSQNTAFAIVANKTALFACFVLGTWNTILTA